MVQLLQLGEMARKAESPDALGYTMVNDTHSLLPYRQAALWLSGNGNRAGLQALSGQSLVESNSPFVIWLNGFAKQYVKRERADSAHAVDLASLEDETREEWLHWLPPHMLWLPLRQDKRVIGALLLTRAEPWQDAESRLLEHLMGIYSHAWAALQKSRRVNLGRRLLDRRWKLTGFALLAVILLLPIRQSVLAPAEVVAYQPRLVRAPIDGVIESLHVSPNQRVEADQLLISLDSTTLDKELAVAHKELETIQAEHKQAAQRAFFDKDSKAMLNVLESRLEQQQAQLTYLTSLQQRLTIRARSAGLAIFDDANDWLGRPVKIGERIMEIADPQQVELQIHLPVQDAILLEPGTEVAFFLTIRPQYPISAELTYAGYKAQLTPDGILAYRLKGRFSGEQQALRIGLKGTAKLYGESVTLFYYLMRRPLSVLRQWFGF